MESRDWSSDVCSSDLENAMQEEVNNAYNELVTAFLKLRLIPDKSLLEDLINQDRKSVV